MLAAVSDQLLQSLFKQLSKWPKTDRVKDKQKEKERKKKIKRQTKRKTDRCGLIKTQNVM